MNILPKECNCVFRFHDFDNEIIFYITLVHKYKDKKIPFSFDNYEIKIL